MGVGVLILGHSGAGKSTSLRNFKKGEIGILNVAGKPLPFRRTGDAPDVVNTRMYGTIMGALQKNSLNAYCIDDANYLMTFENFKRVNERGYEKFTDMAYKFEQLLEAINYTDEDTIVYVMMHVDEDAATGRVKPKTIGKMLDEKLGVEGMFPIVLLAQGGEDGYVLVTNGEPNTPVKSPMGMFEQRVIANDLKAVDTTVRDYFGMAPLGGKKPAKKAAE